jgi:hypothetical protein
MFVVNDVGRGCAIPAMIRALNDGAMAQGPRQSCKTTVEKTLMRRLVTAFPCVRPGLPRSASARRCSIIGHTIRTRVPHRGSAAGAVFGSGTLLGSGALRD